MTLLTLVCFWFSPILLQGFTDDEKVLVLSTVFLQVTCLNFIPSGLVFTCSGMFQSLGNTSPALLSNATRLVTFVAPAIWLAQQPDFALEHIWYLSVTTVALQAVFSFYLLRREFFKKLPKHA